MEDNPVHRLRGAVAFTFAQLLLDTGTLAKRSSSGLPKDLDAGDVIKDSEGARKVRWKRAGGGKSNGARVIYFHLVDDEVALLLMAYAQAIRETVSAKGIKRWRPDPRCTGRYRPRAA